MNIRMTDYMGMTELKDARTPEKFQECHLTLPFQTITFRGFQPSHGSFFGVEGGWHSANFN
jgi:hypothetical protein